MLEMTSEQAAGVLESPQTEGYAVRAAEVQQAHAARASYVPGSRRDFLQALELLGDGRTLEQLRNARSTQWSVRVHLSLPRAKWSEVFGEPQEVEEYRLEVAERPLHLWRHFCPDGPITCIGHLFDQPSGEPWVIVVRVSLV
jgi:hypothetical protein